MMDVVYAQPLKGKEYGYCSDFRAMPWSLGLGGWFTVNQYTDFLVKPFGKYYSYKQLGDERKYELIFFSPRKDENLEKIKWEIKAKLDDTLEQEKLAYSDIYKEISKFNFTALTRSLFIQYWIPIQMILFAATYGFGGLSWISAVAGSYLLLGRAPLIQRAAYSALNRYFDDIQKGIEKAFNNLDIKHIYHPDLEILLNTVESIEDDERAYIAAMHKCDELLHLPPEIREGMKRLYSQNVGVKERERVKQTVGYPFTVTGRLERKPVKIRRRRFRATSFLPKSYEIELFDYRLGPGSFDDIKTGRKMIAQMNRHAKMLGAEVITAYESEYGNTNFYLVGNKKSPIRIWFTPGHGDEKAGRYAIAKAFMDLAKNGKYRDEVLEKALLIFQPLEDAKGADLEAWTTVDMKGRVFHWPPEKFISLHNSLLPALLAYMGDNPIKKLFYKQPNLATSLFHMSLARDRMRDFTIDGTTYRDWNGVWGDEVRPDEIWNMQEVLLKELRPTHGVNTHETVRTYLGKLAQGKGHLMTIEDFALSESLRNDVYRKVIKSLVRLDPRNIRSRVPAVQKILEHNPYYKLGGAAMAHVRRRGFKTLSGEHQAFLEAPSLWPQIVPIGIGRAIDGPMLYTPNIRLKSSWSLDKMGTAFIVTETMWDEIEERVAEQKALMEGLIFYLTKVGDYR